MTEHNPKLYREMSEPHENMEALNAALGSFFDDVAELRKKHKLRDVVFIVNTSYVAKDGEEIDGGVHGSFGNSLNHESMLAHTLGLVQANRQESIAKMLGKGLKAGRRED